MCAILKKSVDEESTLGTVLQRSLPDMFFMQAGRRRTRTLENMASEQCTEPAACGMTQRQEG